MIWTGDHLDAARRLQATLVAPAREAAARRCRPRRSAGSAFVYRVLGLGAPREPAMIEVAATGPDAAAA